MDKIKENVVNDFYKMIQDSWTYEKLTETEKKNFSIVLDSIQVSKALKGSYNQRWNILQSIYTSFLYALNYTSIGWREPLEDIPLF